MDIKEFQSKVCACGSLNCQSKQPEPKYLDLKCFRCNRISLVPAVPLNEAGTVTLNPTTTIERYMDDFGWGKLWHRDPVTNMREQKHLCPECLESHSQLYNVIRDLKERWLNMDLINSLVHVGVIKWDSVPAHLKDGCDGCEDQYKCIALHSMMHDACVDGHNIVDMAIDIDCEINDDIEEV